jgi:hypothetical protein
MAGEIRMSTPFDELTKELAAGVSRRKAFLRIGAGLGAAVLGLMTRPPARADNKGDDKGIGIGSLCNDCCKAIDDLNDSETHGKCISKCVDAAHDAGHFVGCCTVSGSPPVCR